MPLVSHITLVIIELFISDWIMRVLYDTNYNLFVNQFARSFFASYLQIFSHFIYMSLTALHNPAEYFSIFTPKSKDFFLNFCLNLSIAGNKIVEKIRKQFCLGRKSKGGKKVFRVSRPQKSIQIAL